MNALHLGPFVLPWAPILLAVGYVLAVRVAALARRRGAGNAEPALLPLLLLALVAARAGFVLRHLDAYTGAWAMLDVRDRGFDMLTGVLAGVAGVAVWAWRRPALRGALMQAAAAGLVVVVGGLALIRALQAPNPPLPALTLARVQGGTIDLRALQGRPLVLNLWASWCPPCRRELPILAHAAMQNQAARFVLVDEGEPAQRVAAYLRQAGLPTEPFALDPTGALASQYKAPGFPTTLFIAADGTVQRMYIGELSAATLAQGLTSIVPGAPR